MSNKKQTAVEWIFDNLNICFDKFDNGEYSYTEFVNASNEIKEQAKEMENKLSHEYAEFAIRCDRQGMKILNFKDWIKL